MVAEERDGGDRGRQIKKMGNPRRNYVGSKESEVTVRYIHTVGTR